MIELVSDQDWKSSDFTLWSQPQGWFKRSIEEQEVGRPTGSIDPSHSTHSNLGDETGLRSVEEEEEVYESQLLWRDEMAGDDDESRWTEGLRFFFFFSSWVKTYDIPVHLYFLVLMDWSRF